MFSRSDEFSGFATHRWYMILSIFYDRMPLKRHWRLLWPYDSSFTGREAVEFLLHTLPTFIHDKIITRQHCVKLLQRILSNGLIVNVRSATDRKFSDTAVIFRFDTDNMERELLKTGDSSFNVSMTPPACIRRVSSNPRLDSFDDTSPQQFYRATSNTKSQIKAKFFSSFRDNRHVHRRPPIFHAPPPPSLPPPVRNGIRRPFNNNCAPSSPPIKLLKVLPHRCD